MTPLQSQALQLFENKSDDQSGPGISKNTVALIGLATTTALCCLGLINPGLGVIMGAGCAMMTKPVSETRARADYIQEAKLDFDKLGLNPVHVVEVKKDLILVSFGNDESKLQDHSLDERVKQIAHKLLTELGGSCLLAKSTNAIGFKITP